MYNTCTATIDLAAIGYNFNAAKTLAPNSKVMAVIKANAYGHGLEAIAKALPQADGFAVARLSEALSLRNSGITQRILLLGSHLNRETVQHCAQQQIDIVIHSEAQAELVLAATPSRPINAWLKLDIGMHRLGISPEQYSKIHRQLSSSKHIASLVLMSHFSSADEVQRETTSQQQRLFEETTHSLPGERCLANSAAIIGHSSSHQDWIRPGIMLYGANPMAGEHDRARVDLKPAMTLSAKVIAIRDIAGKQGVGYNHRWQSSKNTRLATIGIGYADGYPRHAKNGTPVLINGQRAHLAGTVSMDLISVDISHCSGINIGDDAILWGPGLPAEEVAAYADTISYHLFTAVAERVTREYINAE